VAVCRLHRSAAFAQTHLTHAHAYIRTLERVALPKKRVLVYFPLVLPPTHIQAPQQNTHVEHDGVRLSARLGWLSARASEGANGLYAWEKTVSGASGRRVFHAALPHAKSRAPLRS
jgi:hypothetical protein